MYRLSLSHEVYTNSNADVNVAVTHFLAVQNLQLCSTYYVWRAAIKPSSNLKCSTANNLRSLSQTAHLASCCFFLPTSLYTSETPSGSVEPDMNVEEERASALLLDEDFPCFERQETVFMKLRGILEISWMAKILSLTSQRALCSYRTLVPSKRIVTNRHSSHIAVKCPAHHFCNNDSSCFRKDLRRSNNCFVTPWNQRRASILTKIPFRNYCAGEISQNCWKCKQPLEKIPAFFCLSCKVVQPPTEGTSYFKIMDW